MRKSLAVILVFLCLAALTLEGVNFAAAQFQGEITINADGTISPSSAPIQQAGNIYTLTSDVTGSITAEKSNIVLDGRGFTVWGGEVYHKQVVLVNNVSDVVVKHLVIPAGPREFGGGYLLVGISLINCTGVTVENNTVTGFHSVQALNGIGFSGINVRGGSSNIIKHNNLLNNLVGMGFSQTSDNLIVDNNVTSNSNYSPYTTLIAFGRSSNNIIYHNNFVNSTFQAKNHDSSNLWDNGFPNGGNYWSDYQNRYPNASIIDKSGIGNTPYFIGEHDRDRYPLMKPFNSTRYLIQTQPPKITVTSPSAQAYNVSEVRVDFTVDKEYNWASYSLDGEQKTILTNGNVIGNLTNGSHTLTVYVNSTFGVEGASETVSFTIDIPTASSTQALPTALVAAVLSATTIVAVAGIIVYLKRRR